MKPRKSFLKRSAIKRKHRKPSETLRIYGPPARRAFVASLPCAACGVVGYSENAHIENGGMGRKADYTKIIPLCGPRPTALNRAGMTAGHHWIMDTLLGRERFEVEYGISLSTEASRVQKLWELQQQENLG